MGIQGQSIEKFEIRMNDYIINATSPENPEFLEQKNAIMNNGDELEASEAIAAIKDQYRHEFIRRNIKEYMELYFDNEGQNQRILTDTLACDNGGFENDFQYYQGFTTTYRRGSNSCTPFSGANPSVYVPVTLPDARRFEIMTSGVDDLIGINKTKFGGKSLRINSQYAHTSTHNCNGNYGVDKIVKRFKVTEETRDFTVWYAVAIENPSGHVNQQPFLNIKCDRDLVNELCFDADIVECETMVTDSFCVYDDIDVLEWTCHRFKISEEYIDSIATLEIVVGDCGQGGHFGYAYIDGLCEECTGSALGSITLSDSLDVVPGIAYKSCDGETARVCGTYTLPTICGNWHPLEVSVPGYTISNISIDTTNKQFCFDFSISNFNGADCIEIYTQTIFENETFKLPFQLSNTIDICESLYESYTYDINVGDCEVAAVDGGTDNISDDHFYVELDLGNTGGASWTINRALDNPYPNESGEHDIADGTGDTNIELGPFMIQDGSWEMVIQLGDCTYIEYIEAPDYCSGCDEFFELEIDNIQCVNETDWSFDIYVPSTGNSNDNYKFLGNTYLFGVMNTISVGAIKDGCIPIVLVAFIDNSFCEPTTEMTICPPKPCDETSVAYCDFSIYLNEKTCYVYRGVPFTTYSIDYVDGDTYYNNTCFSLEDVDGTSIDHGIFDTTSGSVGVINVTDAYLTICRSNTSCSLINYEEEQCCKTIFLPAIDCVDRTALRSDIKEEVSAENLIAIFPNPIINNVLQLSTTEACDYAIYDIRGQLMKKGNLQKGNNKVSLITPSGIYFVVTEISQGTRQYQKFVK